MCNVAAAQSLFSVLVHEIESRSIPWTNIIGFASDTASVMVGKINSVLSRLIGKQRLGCLCHLAALCASAAMKKLPLSVGKLLIDIFYHFKQFQDC